MVDFNKLRERSQSATSTFDAAKKVNAKAEYEDNDATFWNPKRGKDGNGFAIIRFLPASPLDGDDGAPFVKYFRHAFQGPVSGEWYIENCLTTHNRKDPVNDLTRILYKSKNQRDETLAGKYKRKATYVSNILVIKDDLQPECVGKVFKYRYGVKIWGKVESVMFPPEGATPMDPFDFWKGANFFVITKTVKFNGQDVPNYDDSRFDIPKALSDDDDYLRSVWEKTYALKPFLDEKNFKSPEELKAKLDSVLGFTEEERGSAAFQRETAPAATHVLPTTAPLRTVAPVTVPAVEDSMPDWMTTAAPTVASVATGTAVGDDDELAAMRKLAGM
jgi:hypothetical protein